MITTNLITFEVHFLNSTETLICNTSNNSLNELTNYLIGQKYIFNKVKEYSKKDSKFKQCNKQRFIDCINYKTELMQLLKF